VKQSGHVLGHLLSSTALDLVQTWTCVCCRGFLRFLAVLLRFFAVRCSVLRHVALERLWTGTGVCKCQNSTLTYPSTVKETKCVLQHVAVDRLWTDTGTCTCLFFSFMSKPNWLPIPQRVKEGKKKVYRDSII